MTAMTAWRKSFHVVLCTTVITACGYPALPSLPDGPPVDMTDAPEPGLHVAQTVPGNGATTVDVNAPLVITFDKSLDLTTVSALSATLTAPGGTAVQATVAGADQMITLTPSQRLPGNAFMTAKVTTQVRGTGGDTLTADFSWTFTTGYGTTHLLAAQEFTVRDIPPDGIPDVFVGGTPPPRILFVKKGTEDRCVIEFDISQFPTDVVSAKLDFDSDTGDTGAPSTRLEIYIFDADGVPALADFTRTQTLFAEDLGADGTGRKSHSFELTSQLENARTRGVQFIGFLILADNTTQRFDLIPSTQMPNTGAPQLTVVY
jgi:hypothetical protein